MNLLNPPLTRNLEMTKFVSQKIRQKSSARLAAVQAVYMACFSNLPVDEVIEDFITGKVGRYAIDEDVFSHTEELVELSPLDGVYFEKIVRGVFSKKEALEKSLAQYINEKYDFEKMDGTMRALLLCAAFELTNTLDVDVKVLIQEYVDLAYAFFSKNEPKMVNALLDQIAHSVRI